MIKRFLMSLLAATSLATVSVPAVAVYAAYDVPGNVCEGINPDSNRDCSDNGGVTNIIKEVINVLSWAVGVISIIMIVIGGFKYMTSGGEAQNVAGAKNTILYAVVGLVIALLAQAIVRFVFARATA